MKPRAEFLCEGSVHASIRVSIEYNLMHPSAKLQAYARRTTRRKHAAVPSQYGCVIVRIIF